MNATTKPTRTESSAVMLAIDLAREVFELAFADAAGRIVERKRPSASRLPCVWKIARRCVW